MLTFSYCSAVAVAYVFGWMVMVLSAVGFFFGSNAQKVCQSLEGPEYEGFINVRSQELAVSACTSLDHHTYHIANGALNVHVL